MNKKVIFLGDLHLGARSGSNHFSDYFNRFFDETPLMIKQHDSQNNHLIE
jgi:hypothetical protein